MQHQMELLKPTYIAPNMTALTEMTILNILSYLVKLDGVDRMFAIAKQDISKQSSRYEP